ncbi:hypothetical protein [uncultured Thiodictyon sp.]|uniref:hypothetical protein n=1 Tax=uncultured Thiodictyon sp. TaxID=1846217 RepID=UPI0025E4784A|nr:hypothetical protein [uncultured Thiodictyon sp.]
MNERLAFFCNRDTAPCHLYTWARPHADGDTLYQVYCRGALTDPWPPADGPAIDLETIRARVTAAAGGLIAATRLAGAGTQLRLATIPATGYDPASQLLLLRPGLEPEWQPIGPDAIDLGPGAFVLLPAIRADQSNLQALLEHLERLPSDYRALLLNVLRRPGIEGALWRLERRLAHLTGQQDQAPPVGGNLGWPWVLAPLLVLNLLATLGSVCWTKPSPGIATAPPTYSFERVRYPLPVPNWAGCGPPWFCQAPLAPGRLKPGGGALPAALEIGAEKPKLN